ncbi:hypothetical protein SeLEV6574_g06757 [Synchytrium endobioticum]|uniref:Uncharacterized protein n=1 Tax=Synchytrium endobioticum TaxID=286115 RepID=A0A507CMT7_9FUNG|nr:hypothetical protein SeLEV6574_g06757 [Synchytrium endobioticum]
MKVVHPGLARARVERLARRIENPRKSGLRAAIVHTARQNSKERNFTFLDKLNTKLLQFEQVAMTIPDERIEIGLVQEKPCWAIYMYDGFSMTDHHVCDVSDKNNPKGVLEVNTKPDDGQLTRRMLDAIEDDIIRWITKWQSKHPYKIFACGIGITDPDLSMLSAGVTPTSAMNDELFESNIQVKSSSSYTHFPKANIRIPLTTNNNKRIVLTSRLPARLWLDLDTLPILCCIHAHELSERACSAARKCACFFGHELLPKINIGKFNEVEVDADGWIHMNDLIDFRSQLSCDGKWQYLLNMAQKTRNRNLKLAFISSTAQGGGVALMRHAIIRLFRLLHIDAHWYVTRPSPAVFDITKRKIHNVLQDVTSLLVRNGIGAQFDAVNVKGRNEESDNEDPAAANSIKDVCLKEEDESILQGWWKDNVERYWEKGVFRNMDVIVIDDPQPCGLIPIIREINASCKIIYRSHIHLRTDLIDTPGTSQNRVWEFLWKNISLAGKCFGFCYSGCEGECPLKYKQMSSPPNHADCVISHPVEAFVPASVRCNVFSMPASTCGHLDGLNKELRDLTYYQALFNRFCWEQIGRQVDFFRPYIVQICRFDPAKGIPDLIQIYARFRAKLNSEDKGDGHGHDILSIPQLIITGHGSVDDPDATLIFEQTMNMLESPEYDSIRQDILLARIPSSDQILNALMRGAIFATQMSISEGFEIKVTEAIIKGKPVIAYASGGIPLQIWHGVTGYLVETGNIELASKYFYILYQDRSLRERMSNSCKRLNCDDFFTATNALNWLVLSNALLDGILPSGVNSTHISPAHSPPKQHDASSSSFPPTQHSVPAEPRDDNPVDGLAKEVTDTYFADSGVDEAERYEMWKNENRSKYSGKLTSVKDLWNLYIDM